MLRPERMSLVRLLRTMVDVEWELPTECPAWNVKGIALHILGDDFSLLTRQRDASTNSLILFAEDHPGMSFRALLDGFNEQWVTASRFFSTQLLIEMLGVVGDWSEAFYRDVGLETISQEPVGLFAETELSPYWQVIAREYVERFVHQHQIRRAVFNADSDAPLTRAAARVTVHLLAAWMKDYAPAVGSAISVDFAVGAWTWVREAQRWTVLEGTAEGAAAQVAVASDEAVRLLSRGMTSNEVVSNMTVSGDDALARGAIEIIAPLVGRPTTPG
jgi:hypothetical protein